jgi:hypothetical protein
MKSRMNSSRERRIKWIGFGVQLATSALGSSPIMLMVGTAEVQSESVVFVSALIIE